MNKELILFQLREAREATDKLISDIEAEPDYDYGNFVVDMSHVYHHVNTAWNGRDAPSARVAESSESDFQKWRQFPQDLEIL